MKKICLVVLALIISAILPTVKADASILMDGSTTFTHLKFDALVYWRVYSPEDSTSPLGAISDYGYFYQIHNAGTGTDKAITQFGVDNPFGDVITTAGYLTTFNLGGLTTGRVAPSAIDYGGDNSGSWSFSPTKIPLGKNSYLLYFTTPYSPTIVNGGVIAGSYDTQAPVPGPAPEPATVAMLSLGFCGLCGSVLKKFKA